MNKPSSYKWLLLSPKRGQQVVDWVINRIKPESREILLSMIAKDELPGALWYKKHLMSKYEQARV
jgi:hypothetical protein